MSNSQDENISNWWWAPAFGLIIGSAPSGTANKDDKNEKGKGYWTPFGLGVWLYGGVSAGYGRTVGPYVTTGPMIGTTFDWGFGGGIQYKGWGLGVILPIGETLKAIARHPERTTALIEQGNQLLAYAQYHAAHYLPALSGLEKLVSG